MGRAAPPVPAPPLAAPQHPPTLSLQPDLKGLSEIPASLPSPPPSPPPAPPATLAHTAPAPPPPPSQPHHCRALTLLILIWKGEEGRWTERKGGCCGLAVGGRAGALAGCEALRACRGRQKVSETRIWVCLPAFCVCVYVWVGGWVWVCVCVNLLKHVTHASMHAVCCWWQQHGVQLPLHG